MNETETAPLWFVVLFIVGSLAVLGGLTTGVVFTVRYFLVAPIGKLWTLFGTSYWVALSIGAVAEHV